MMAVKGMRSEIVVVQHTVAGDSIFSGGIAGIVGGALLMSFAIGTSVMNGGDILSPFRLAGATFIGPAAMNGGTAIILYGALVYLVTSIVWGILFAAILPRDASPGSAFVAGLVYGLVVMLIMSYAVLPLVNPVMRSAVEGTTSFTMEHLIYGGSLALVPMLRRRFTTQGE
ncbi:MAG: hypothetical protein AB1762_06855 [Gemmatimonadota bacterium]